MGKRWLLAGRILWILLALNAIFLFVATTWIAVEMLQHPSERILRGLAEQGLSLQVYGGFFLVSIALLFLSYFAVALLIFLRRPDDGFALFVSVFLLNYGAVLAYPEFEEFVQFYRFPPPWYAASTLIASLFSWTLLIPFLVLYPDGRFVPRWALYVTAFGIVLTLAWSIFPLELSDSTTLLGQFGTVSVLFLTAATFYAQFWRYRHHSSPTEQQQTKWFLFALLIFGLSTVLRFIPPLLELDRATGLAGTIWTDLIATASTLPFMVIPIAIGVSILRYRLWDIDILIRKTLTYAVLGVVLVVVYFGGIIVLQRAFAMVSGNRSEVITVLSTLAIAALFVPLRNKIQSVVDRRFYRKKYDAQKVLADFALTVRDETDLEKLTGRLIQVVQETMEPKSVSVWLRKNKVT